MPFLSYSIYNPLMRISNEKFDEYVQQGIEAIDPEFRYHLAEVPVIVEDEPDDKVCEKMHLTDRRHLLGLFQGVSLRAKKNAHGVCSQITLYRRNILAHCHTEKELTQQINRTIIHELGHYLGFTEQQLWRYRY